jgi:hypothetical protein
MEAPGIVCDLKKLDKNEVLCISHNTIFPNSKKALREHSKKKGRFSFFFFTQHTRTGYIPAGQCNRLLAGLIDLDPVLRWAPLLVPLRQLLFHARPHPLPGFPVVQAVACDSCEGVGWIGMLSSFPKHRRLKHGNDRLVQAIPTPAQQVSKNNLSPTNATDLSLSLWWGSWLS